MREPSCEMAGATARVMPICVKDTAVPVRLAYRARKPPLPPACARSSVDSKAMRRPSPLKEGLRLTPSSVVFVMRCKETDCERAPRRPMMHNARAMQRKAMTDRTRSTGNTVPFGRQP